MFDPVDWQSVLVPSRPLLETIVRGTLVYIAVFLLLRIVLKRQSGTVGVADLLVVVLIADAAQNGMAGDYRSVPDGVILVAVILFWSYAFDWLAYHLPWIGRFVYPPPLELVKDGKILWKNLRRELVTMEELKSQLREQGIEHIENVKTARMEGDGHISAVKIEEEQHAKRKSPT